MANLRTNFSKAPAHVVNQIFGKVKNRDGIMSGLEYWNGYAHVKELFAFLNCKNPEKGTGWFKVNKMNKRTGQMEETVPVPMTTLSNELATLVAMNAIKRIGGDRSATYALKDFDESQLEGEIDEEGEEGEEEEVEEDNDE
jgi:hypothetical protein